MITLSSMTLLMVLCQQSIPLWDTKCVSECVVSSDCVCSECVCIVSQLNVEYIAWVCTGGWVGGSAKV